MKRYPSPTKYGRRWSCGVGPTTGHQSIAEVASQNAIARNEPTAIPRTESTIGGKKLAPVMSAKVTSATAEAKSRCVTGMPA